MVITGASSGLGAALARRFASETTSLALIARRQAQLESLAEELRQTGCKVLPLVCDLADPPQVARTFTRIAYELGDVDVLIANAGVCHFTSIEAFDPEIVSAMFRINVGAAVDVTARVLPSMLKRGRGHIVGIGSLAACKGLPWAGAYCASKAALKAFFEGIAAEARPRGLHVMIVEPGFIATEMTEAKRFPMPFLIQPEVAAEKIARGLARRRSYLAFPLLPRFFMRALTFLPDAIHVRVWEFIQRRGLLAAQSLTTVRRDSDA